MRKKDLIAQNKMFFDRIQKLQIKIKETEKQLLACQSEKESLNEMLKQCKAESEKRTSEIIYQSKPEISHLDIDEITAYGADIIGKIVMRATELSNILTIDGDLRYRELVNLILGKTEIAKAEILTEVSSNKSDDDKKSEMHQIFEETEEYFLSVLAQRN